MNCLFAATGRTRGDEREVRCGHCGYARFSRYEVDQIHRQCTAPESPAIVTQECVFRGLEVIELKACEKCGERGEQREIFVCRHSEHAGPCVLNWWTNRLAPRAGYTCCLTCRDRQLPDGTRPWDAITPGVEVRS